MSISCPLSSAQAAAATSSTPLLPPTHTEDQRVASSPWSSTDASSTGTLQHRAYFHEACTAAAAAAGRGTGYESAPAEAHQDLQVSSTSLTGGTPSSWSAGHWPQPDAWMHEALQEGEPAAVVVRVLASAAGMLAAHTEAFNPHAAGSTSKDGSGGHADACGRGLMLQARCVAPEEQQQQGNDEVEEGMSPEMLLECLLVCTSEPGAWAAAAEESSSAATSRGVSDCGGAEGSEGCVSASSSARQSHASGVDLLLHADAHAHADADGDAHAEVVAEVSELCGCSAGCSAAGSGQLHGGCGECLQTALIAPQHAQHDDAASDALVAMCMGWLLTEEEPDRQLVGREDAGSHGEDEQAGEEEVLAACMVLLLH